MVKKLILTLSLLMVLAPTVVMAEGEENSTASAPGIHHTMGGVEINKSTEVIDTDGNVIPGLFAAGEVTVGIHGGNAILDILVFGKTAADTASEYIK